MNGTPLMRLLGVSLLLGAAACSDASPTASAPETTTSAPTLQMLTCTITVASKSLSCGGAQGPRGVIYGSQGKDVQVRSSNLHYDPLLGTFTFDVTVQNLLPVSIGTRDGVNVDPNGVRLFFGSGPTVTSGTGVVTPVNVDGVELFNTMGSNVPVLGPAPYYQWDQMLRPNETSTVKQWTFLVPLTVGSFTFNLYVSTEVEKGVTPRMPA